MKQGSTLRRQVLAWVSIPLAILWLISAYVNYDIAKRYVNTAYDRALLESALDIGRQVRVLRGRIYVDLPEVAVEMLRTRENGQLYYVVTGPDGEFITGEPDMKVTASAPPPPQQTPQQSPQLQRAGQAHYYDSTYRNQPVRVAVLQFPVETEDIRGHVTVHAAESLQPRTDLARELSIGVALPQAFLAACAALIIWFAVTRALAPLALMRQEIEQRSHRDLSALPVAHVPFEVRPMIEAMNALLTRLGEAMSARQRFIADAAHQLRTPIAGLRTQTELALRETEPAAMRAALSQLQNAVDRTTHLINQLLTLARAEPDSERQQPMERLNLSSFAREVTTEWVPRALARNIDLGFESEDVEHDAASVSGDGFLLREMLGNLIDNATRYTPAGGHVTVRVKRTSGKALLQVEDDGPGIPEAERVAVLERFHRVLGTGVEGAGLGLAIVHEIVMQHGGRIRLLPALCDKGTLAQVDLPLAA